MTTQKKMYLLGAGISHSKSPAHWRATFLERGLNWTYDLMDLPSQPAAIEFIHSHDYIAINITTPWKKLAMDCADEVDAISNFANGCNFLINKNDKLYGYNVDGLGCVADLQSKGIDLADKKIIVCGTGPTARSVACALAFEHAKVIMLTRYTHKEGELQIRDKVINVIDYDHCDDFVRNADIVINATTLGMMQTDPSPLDASLLNSNQVVFDCVYGHGETQILKDAKNVGATFYDGSGMLESQASCCEKLLFAE